MNLKYCRACHGTGKKPHWLFGFSRKTCPACDGNGFTHGPQDPPKCETASRVISEDEFADEIHEIRKHHQKLAKNQGLDPVAAPIINMQTCRGVNMQMYRDAMVSRQPKKRNGENGMPVSAADNVNELANFVSEKLGDDWNDSDMELVTPDGKKWIVSRASVNVYSENDPREDALVIHLEPDPKCELQQTANQRGKPEPLIQRIPSDDEDNAAGFAAPSR